MDKTTVTWHYTRADFRRPSARGHLAIVPDVWVERLSILPPTTTVALDIQGHLLDADNEVAFAWKLEYLGHLATVVVVGSWVGSRN
ncbi:hypothetical protein FVEN_g12874 [Fusarium venenatum]|nr:hypothetical protein FVEN_g12874 [Fusarium venenatum]